MSRRPSLVRAALALAAGGCGVASPGAVAIYTAAPPPSATAEASLRAVDSLRLDDAALLAALAEDAVLALPGLPIVRGRAAAREALELAGLAAPRPERPAARLVAVNAAGDLGYALGVMRASSGRADRYLAVWRRAPDGWRVAAYVEAPGAGLPTVTLDTARARRMRAWYADTAAGARTSTAAELLRADAAFAEEAQRTSIAAAFERYAAPDAVLQPDTTGLVVGPRQIGESMRRGGAGVALRWRPVAGEVAAARDLGFTVGTWERTARGASARGKYLTVWRRQPDGSLRYVADMGNGGS